MHRLVVVVSAVAVSLLLAAPQVAAFSAIALGSVTRLRPSHSKLFSHGDQECSDGPSSGLASRRQALLSLVGTTTLVSLAGTPRKTEAAVTDETNTFANTDSDSSYRGLQSDRTVSSVVVPSTAPSDEVVILVPKSGLSKGLGLELSQVDFRTNIRVFVKGVAPGSVADQLKIQKDWVVVSVNGKSAERTNAEGVAILVSQAAKATPADGSIEIRFRDPSVFRDRLNGMSATGEVSTQVAPAGDTTQRNRDGSVKLGRAVTEQQDQRLTVTQLVPPKLCKRGATTDDLLEISYLGMVVETGEVFDGSAIKINGEGVPGRGNDVSLFFVLGKQPFGQFPPGWDVGLEGMCVVSLF